MKRLWGVSLGIALVCTLYGDTNALRTPTGYLWAGTTFTLQAHATAGSLTQSSAPAQVRVGQIIHWQTMVDSPAGASIPTGSAVFSTRVVNMGNGYDRLSFEAWQDELTDLVWTVRLYENPRGDGQISGSTLIATPGSGGQGGLIAPGETIQYLVQATPPGSSIPTDGVWVAATYNTSVPSRTNRLLGEFVAGVRRSAGVHSRAFSSTNYHIHVAPVLVDSRLFWIGTDSATNRSLLYYTPNPITVQGSTLSSNRQTYGRALSNFAPSGFSVVLGTGWFTGNGSQLVRIDLARVLANNTSADPYQVVSLPNTQPRLDLTPAIYNGRLYVAGADNRLHVIRDNGTWAAQSARPSTTVGNFSCSPLVAGSSLYIGTDRGYILRFDLTNGGIAQSRQVASNLPIRSLALTRDGRLLLARAGDNRVLGLLVGNLTTYYYYNTPQPIVSPLTYHWDTDTVLFMTQDGFLYALNAQTGMPRPHYPQQIWSGQPLQRATLAVMLQEGRKAYYVYALAQQATAGGGTQGRFAMITLVNPYNRYEVSETSMYTGSDYLPWISFTGDQSYSFCLIAARTHATPQGFVAAINIR
ncbi:MAG: PQQ-binding-like beta-propeller repeat protein [Fimbriimonadales bacterium]|nr:PQQ-binding-like beta-propeller repeat protein [Fimbriimonadales bacterium]